MKNPNGPTGKRTCDLLAYSAAPQPTVPLHTPPLPILVSAKLFFCSEADLVFAFVTSGAIFRISVKLKVVMIHCYKNSILNWNTIPVI